MSILPVYSLLSILLSLAGGFLAPHSVLFQSIESKTEHGEVVFNRISLIKRDNQDIWTMKQSHKGKLSKDWDHIQIIVDKTTRPFTATFAQFDSKGNEVEYRTSCFRCHSGGPRAIRAEAGLSFSEKIKIEEWNALIKSYGEVVNVETELPDQIRGTRLSTKPLDQYESLELKACFSCHRKGGVRAPLTAEHRLTIKHLVKTKQMPPWPHQLSGVDKNEVKRFIYGF